MKKLILLLFCILFGFNFYNNTTKHKVNVYLFWGNGCPHCEDAKEFFNSIEEEYGKYYNLIEYEVWYDENNNNLMNKVALELNYDVKGVPYIIIGEQSFNGYNNSIGISIKDAIKEEYNNKNYRDIVGEVNE